MFALKVRPGHPDFLDLPWADSIVDWPTERFVEFPRGPSQIRRVHPAWRRLALRAYYSIA